jgi:DNA-cytosine methyltransferase
MKILSLFDGISVARVALERAGIPVEVYYASEIDKYAIQISQKNWSDIVQIGNVENVRANPITLFWGTKSECSDITIDLLIGGSPCQDLSIAKRDRKGLSGERSGLFWEYVRILNEVKPKYFILENVNSMPKEAKDLITKTLGRYLYSEDEWDIID